MSETFQFFQYLIDITGHALLILLLLFGIAFSLYESSMEYFYINALRRRAFRIRAIRKRQNKEFKRKYGVTIEEAERGKLLRFPHLHSKSDKETEQGN